MKCLLYGVISFIFIKINFKLTWSTRQVNDHLRAECRSNKFHFIINDNIANKSLWKDGLHLSYGNTYMFTRNLIDFSNGFCNRNVWLTKDNNTNLGKKNWKQGFDISAKTKQSNKIYCRINVTSNVTMKRR